jgi:hypothetical protein
MPWQSSLMLTSPGIPDCDGAPSCRGIGPAVHKRPTLRQAATDLTWGFPGPPLLPLVNRPWASRSPPFPPFVNRASVALMSARVLLPAPLAVAPASRFSATAGCPHCFGRQSDTQVTGIGHLFRFLPPPICFLAVLEAYLHSTGRSVSTRSCACVKRARPVLLR